MAHFNFDQQLTDAMRLDQSLNLNTSVARQSLKPSNRLNVSGVNLNRSRSASRISPSLCVKGSKPLCRSKSPARRSKTPTRLGTSFGVGNVSTSNIYNGRKSQGGSDRFIPNRSTTDMEFAQHSLANDTDNTDNTMSAAEYEKRKMMEENLNPGDHSRILSFKSKAPAAKDGHLNNMKVLYSTGKPAAPKATNTRNIPSAPEKILDAPDMLNDFYLHLMDWSSLNHVAVSPTNFRGLGFKIPVRWRWLPEFTFGTQRMEALSSFVRGKVKKSTSPLSLGSPRLDLKIF